MRGTANHAEAAFQFVIIDACTHSIGNIEAPKPKTKTYYPIMMKSITLLALSASSTTWAPISIEAFVPQGALRPRVVEPVQSFPRWESPSKLGMSDDDDVSGH